MSVTDQGSHTGGNGATPHVPPKTNAAQASDAAAAKAGAKAKAPAAGQTAAEPEGQESSRPGTVVTTVLKRNEPDSRQAIVTDIFWATDRFIIYEADGEVRYILPDDYRTARELRRRIAELGGLRASIEELRARSALSAGEKQRAAREIAWALADAFEDDAEKLSEKPKDVLMRVDSRLRSLVKSAYRKKFVLANLTAFILIEMVLLVLAVGLTLFVADALVPLPQYAVYGAMGGLGAFLSVMIGVRGLEVNLDLKAWEQTFAGATRIFIGVVGAWVVGLALASKLIDPTFGSVADNAEAGASTLSSATAMILVLTFIAGFSESLVPNLLRRGETAAGGDEASAMAGEPIMQKMQP